MKIPIAVATIALVAIGLVAGFYFYNQTLLAPTDPSPSPTPITPTAISVAQLQINHLLASSNGTISFDVSLSEYDSGVLEAVFINETQYSWPDGGTENAVILKGQTQHWSKDFEGLIPGTQIQVTVQATPVWGNATTTVEQPYNPNVNTLPDFLYDLNNGVSLFDQGIHVIATSQNPLTQLENSGFTENYWNLMHNNIITQATSQDFISILISRGDKPTGGYNLQIENFSWLESYPVKFLFQVNFTDPGEDLLVTQALTNPLVLVPIGKLSPGDYKIEVPIAEYILNIDEKGNTHYTQIMTFAAVIWEQTLTISE